MSYRPHITYDEFQKLYWEAIDCQDWGECDKLADDYPDYEMMLFADDDEEEEDDSDD